MTEPEAQKPKSKRTTVADLEKRLDVLGHENIKELMTWCGELDARLEQIEKIGLENLPSFISDSTERFKTLEKGTTTLQGNQSTLMKQYIEQQKRLDEEKPDSAVTNVTDRLTALENATGALADAVREIAAGVADWGTRMEDAEDSIHSLQAALTTPQKSATHIEPAQLPRPIPEPGVQVEANALKAVAQVAQTMGDVLNMTRVLQAASGLSDEERRQIMAIACQAAGVPYSENLLVRAGVRSFEA